VLRASRLRRNCSQQLRGLLKKWVCALTRILLLTNTINKLTLDIYIALTQMIFFRSGLGSEDVGIKVNSRKILSEIVALAGVPNDKFAATCVLIDKLEKVSLESLSQDFVALGLSLDVVQTIVQHLTHRDIEYFSTLLGQESAGVQDMKQLYALARFYGFQDWLVFDPTVVRGLAYYTGVVFEGFDRKKQFRAICGGGRYDTLLETFGDDKIPAVGMSRQICFLF
jgi:histidyl-tRNA synthetase